MEEKPKSCEDCKYGKSTSGQAKCCGYLLTVGETVFIQNDGFIRQKSCVLGYWKK